jgi:hypothetical protein
MRHEMFPCTVVVVVFPPISVRNQLLMRPPVRGSCSPRVQAICRSLDRTPIGLSDAPPLERTRTRCGRRASAPSRRADLVRTGSFPAVIPRLCGSGRSGRKPFPSRDHPGLCDRHNPDSMSVATPANCEPRRNRPAGSEQLRAAGARRVPIRALRDSGRTATAARRRAKGDLPRRGYDLDCWRPRGAEARLPRGGRAETSACS